jgi:hypothetical protein
VYHGMEGPPGHQAGGLSGGDRGAYGNDQARTFGGFDQMTAIVGGLWDSLLGDGRRFWIVATSDSHVNFADPQRQGGSDFWPGQYQKTYVLADRTYDDILDGLRNGRIFAVAGDLISELDIRAETGSRQAGTGETLRTSKGDDIKFTVRFHVPEGRNANGDNPAVRRVDVIVGDVHGPARDRNSDKNESTKVYARVSDKEWTMQGNSYSFSVTLPKVDRNIYIRVRGTATTELEPAMDAKGENPWNDLWFYSNPVFVEVN